VPRRTPQSWPSGGSTGKLPRTLELTCTAPAGPGEVVNLTTGGYLLDHMKRASACIKLPGNKIDNLAWLKQELDRAIVQESNPSMKNLPLAQKPQVAKVVEAVADAVNGDWGPLVSSVCSLKRLTSRLTRQLPLSTSARRVGPRLRPTSTRRRRRTRPQLDARVGKDGPGKCRFVLWGRHRVLLG
jgi:hypothetical protein